MRKIKKTDYKVVISENNQNQLLETFISMKFNAECNETTPAISFHRFHGNIQNDETSEIKLSMAEPKSSS